MIEKKVHTWHLANKRSVPFPIPDPDDIRRTEDLCREPGPAWTFLSSPLTKLKHVHVAFSRKWSESAAGAHAEFGNAVTVQGRDHDATFYSPPPPLPPGRKISTTCNVMYLISAVEPHWMVGIPPDPT